MRKGARGKERHGGNGAGGNWSDRFVVRALGWGWRTDMQVRGVGRALSGKGIWVPGCPGKVLKEG